MRLAFAIARRDLRGSLQAVPVFLLCLALGVAAIAAVGTLRAAITSALTEQGATLLGGDAQMSFTYRFADDAERAFMDSHATRVSEIVTFRSMAVVGEDRALTEVKAVDDIYPLTGALTLDPPLSPAAALGDADGLPGAVMDPLLADRLGLVPGDTFRLGETTFRLTARLIREPDSAAGGFGLAPRLMVRLAALDGSGLLAPGTLFDSHYRMDLPKGADLAVLERAAKDAFPDTGLRWADSRRAAPGAERFVDMLGSFLVLVGLAGLAVGGVGIAAATRAHVAARLDTIAVLKALGAESRTIFAAFLIQIAVLTGLGVALGLVVGTLVPMLAAPLIAHRLPISVAIAPAPRALAEAAVYGVLAAALFALWPLARVYRLRAATLFRDLGPDRRNRPGPRLTAVLVALVAAIAGAAIGFTGLWRLTLSTLGGVAVALGLLALAAAVLRALSRRAAPLARGRPALRAAFAALAGPREEATSVVLSLGLGLSVLAAVGQIDANLRAAIDRDLPDRAPAFFFVDIQPDQITPFLDRARAAQGVTRVDSAPMLRGIITRINDRPAAEVAGPHWVLQGDRGVTYSATKPANVTLTQGTWWPEDYAGPPLVSFSADEAAEMGLKLGDRLTINILGRDIEATIASFRSVDFSSAGIGFILAMNPVALAGAPHSHIATVYTDPAAGPGAEAALLRDLAGRWPNITAIRVTDVIARVSEAMAAIAQATALAAGMTLITGLVVLIGAAAAGLSARAWESAILRTLGATRTTILASFALRSALAGAAAGVVAVGFGAASAWAVMHFVMQADYRFEPASALALVTGGAALSLIAGLGFSLRALSSRPAGILRARD